MAVVGKTYTSAERELTQILVTELLAHQFCFPVEWIDTQDVFLRDFAAERVVEVGPAETLINMAKKTVKASYSAHDTATGLKRDYLSYKKNADAIYYKVDAANAVQRATPKQTAAPAKTEMAVPAAAAPTAAPVATPVAAPAGNVAIPDTPVAAIDILIVVVALALKKQTSDIAKDQTIKKLCGGRSTLQNEIVGDFTKEFSSLPDQPEDTPLADLGAHLTDSGVGAKLGPCTVGLVNKLASTKLPAGSGTASMRGYLDSRWGFKQGLQDRALLVALTRQPAARFGDVKAMEAFLDELAQTVLQDVGIDPASLSSSSSATTSSASTAISSEALEALQKSQRADDQRLFELYAKRTGTSLADAASAAAEKQKTIDQLQGKIDAWSAEHGDAYEKGIQPRFDARKARVFDSYWNWVVQDLVATFAALVRGTADMDSERVREELARFQTRATPRLGEVVRYLQGTLGGMKDGQGKSAAREWLGDLQAACREANVAGAAVFKHSVPSMVPVLNIDEQGRVSVDEVPRDQASEMESVVSLDDADEMASLTLESFAASASASSRSASGTSTPLRSLASTASSAIMARSVSSGGSSTAASDSPMRGPVDPLSRVTTFSLAAPNSPPVPAFLAHHDCPEPAGMPQLKVKGPGGWQRDHLLTRTYLRWFQTAATKGVSFADTAVLVTGAGQRSIGAEVVRLLLAAGAKVVVTTSSYSEPSLAFYEQLYRAHGGRGAELVVVPFNGGSAQDTDALVAYIYDTLRWDLDHVVPFAAVGEAGRAIDALDAHAELAHRVMLTNTVRLLGALKTAKAAARLDTHPTHVVLPLSPNHGSFGRDGLYAESKLGLEALLGKWHSEDWADYLTVCGAVIGWTRGTGLMGSNDVLATGIEEDLRVRTFSAAEMAWHVVGLMHPAVAGACDMQPLVADLSGGLKAEMNLKVVLDRIQAGINAKSEVRKAISRDRALEAAGDTKPAAGAATTRKQLSKRARFQVERSSLPAWEELAPLNARLEGMVDLERVVVAVGFGETGPYGSARTRWQAETNGVFSVDGCVELAWVMGLIKYHNGPLAGKDYCGWVDAQTKAPLTDAAVKTKFEAHMVEHTGIRVLEQQGHDAVEPDQQQLLHEVSVTEDLEPFEVSAETASDLVREHGDKVAISHQGEQVFATLKKGGTLWIPKATAFGHAVAAQLPTGWDARVYGIPEDTISQVDPVTLYALVSTVEAFLSAGITDPFELYGHVHVADVGNAVGASLGGIRSLHRMFKQRFLDRQVQKDVLAETFVNTTAAWVNMLLLGAAGPIRTPVGACATSLESVDTGYDLIMTGKARAVLVGGTDGFEKETAAEFANMQATIDADKDAAAGRPARQASRPTASSRAGFVESEGCGIQLLTTARLALDMGLPVHAVIALTHTAADKIGRSVPAPGQGVLTAAGEKPRPAARFPNPMLDVAYRRRQLALRRAQISEKRATELAWLRDGLAAQRRGSAVPAADAAEGAAAGTAEFADECRRQIEADAARALKEALNTYGNDFYRGDDSVAPLRGALAVWGLTVDDLGVASLHGTSTVKNDINETDVIQKQLAHLGRTKGNVLPCVCQKSLIGHGKGAAGAFALNGCLQMLNTGLVPGNRNADNIDGALAERDLLFFPSATYAAADGIKAFSVTSFGFGQKGAQVVGVHPRYLFAALREDEYAAYGAKVVERRRKADRALQEGIYGGRLVQLKEKSVYEDKDLEDYLLNRR